MTSALGAVGTAATAAGEFLATPGGQALGQAAGQIGAAALGARASGRAAGQLAAGAQAGRADIQSAITQGRGDIGAAFQPSLAEIRGTLQPSLAEVSRGVSLAGRSLREISRPGISAFDIQAAQSGALGPEAQRQAFAAFQESPEQEFLRQQGEQAITRQAAATGGLGGARVLEALQQRGIGLAAQQFGQQFQRLGQVAAPGLQAQQTLAGIQAQQGISRAGIRQATGINLANIRQATGTGLANIALGGGAPLAQLSQAVGQAGAAGSLGRGGALQAGLGGAARGGGQFAGFSQPVGSASGRQISLSDFGRIATRTVQGAKLGSAFGPVGTLLGGVGGAALGIFGGGGDGGDGGFGDVGPGPGGGEFGGAGGLGTGEEFGGFA